VALVMKILRIFLDALERMMPLIVLVALCHQWYALVTEAWWPNWIGPVTSTVVVVAYGLMGYVSLRYNLLRHRCFIVRPLPFPLAPVELPRVMAELDDLADAETEGQDVSRLIFLDWSLRSRGK
jgi:hypothetical protein